MTAYQIASAITKAKINVDKSDIFDDDYSLPTKRWILGPFSEAFSNRLIDDGVSVPRTNANDCDDFAYRAWDFAKILNTRSNPSDLAIAFGVLVFYPDNANGIGHAINFAIVSNEGEIMFYEPQTRKELILSTSEHYLCSYCCI